MSRIGRMLDLNLLRVFDVLMQERHVSRAADRLGLTQSSTSNALDRLRNALDDRVLERQGNRMVPTRAALDLWPHVQASLQALEVGLNGLEVFDPREHLQQFSIGVDEYSLHLWGDQILQTVRVEAPHVQLAFLPATYQSDADALLAGTLDVIIGPIWQASPELERQPLTRESFVGLVAADHPIAMAKETAPGIDTYLAYPHILVSPRGIVPGNVDAGLAAIGRERRIVCAAPFYANAPEFLADSDAILNLGSRLAHKMAALHRLHLFELPIEVPGFEIALLWSRRNTASQAHGWMRQVIRRCAGTSDADSG